MDETDLKKQLTPCSATYSIFGLIHECHPTVEEALSKPDFWFDDERKASKVLVFLAIGMNQAFQVPLAFYFTKGSTAAGLQTMFAEGKNCVSTHFIL